MTEQFKNKQLVIGGIIALAVLVVVIVLFAMQNSKGDATVAVEPSLTPTITLTPSSTPIPASMVVAQFRSLSGWLESARGEVIGKLTNRREYPTAAISGNGYLTYNIAYDITVGVNLEDFSVANVTVNNQQVIIRVPPVQVRECILSSKSFFSGYHCTAKNFAGIEVANVCDELKTQLTGNAPSILENTDYRDLLQAGTIKANEVLEAIVEGISPNLNAVIIYDHSLTTGLYSIEGSCANLLGITAPTSTPVPTATITPTFTPSPTQTATPPR